MTAQGIGAVLFSDTGQLVIVFTACVLMIARWATQELARNRRLSRLDADAARKAREAAPAGRQP